MTRALVIGSSHVGALRRAAPAFAEANPDIELDFFGVRGPCFLGGQFKGSVFNPAYGREKDRELSMATNGKLVADAAGYDAILMVGHRFGFPGVLAMLEDLDILEGGRSDRHGLVPQMLVDEVVGHITTADAATLAKATENIDLIIGGHTHTFLPKPTVVKNGSGQNLLVTQVGAYGINSGSTDFSFAEANGKTADGTTILV